ncbi:MAG: PP2C family protein-serine/threonine phosphatase [Gemmatimonadota bacterium]
MTTLQLSGTTHSGRVRGRNEDAWASDRGLGLAVVADGMGGHPAGHVASRLAVDTILDFFGNRDGGSGRDAGEDMAKAVRSANRQILDRGRKNPEQQGMGTTLTVLRVDEEEGRYYIGHVGDSRAYLFRGQSLTPLTRDHTPLQERVDIGLLTREEARVHPLGHVLSQALGTQTRVEPQVVDGEVRPGDLFLLCSDGLNAVLSEERIEEILVRGLADEGENGVAPDDLHSLGDELVEAVLDEGAPDNVTVVFVHVTESE